MISNKGILFTILIPGLLVAACAVSPEAEERRRAMEEEIGFILAEPLDVEQFGETKRCLRDVDFRHFRVLDDKRILFEGRRGRLWLNTLRTRCPDLRYGSILIVRPTLTMGRMCEMDTFRVGDWFDWPWYRRWPWQWGWGWGASGNCVLGEFQPVTESQVNLIEEAISKN